MRIRILDCEEGYPQYLEEILETWGVLFKERVRVSDLKADHLDAASVWLVPAGNVPVEATALLQAYVKRGGVVITLLPQGELARLAGLEFQGARETHLRLRVTGLRAGGLAGESLPIVGKCYRYQPEPDVSALAYIFDPERMDGVAGEHEGITLRHCGEGKVLALAFDLPRAVWMLRQGDPARTGYIPPRDEFRFRHEKPSDMACDIGPRDSGWLPFADLLARLLVDLLQWISPAPLPLLWHLPDKAKAIMLYSGDEDAAALSAVDEELKRVSEGQGRMNLYIIPTNTHSTLEEVRRYREHHDVGPHPDLTAVRFAHPDVRAEEYRRNAGQKRS
jgi:hypothetical protein